MSVDTYETRVLAFIDILGFSNIIEMSQSDPDIFIWLRRMFAELDKADSYIASDNVAMSMLEARVPGLNGTSMFTQMVAFSDSIVLSMNTMSSSQMAVMGIAHRIAELCYRLLDFGCLTRGCITIGDLFHDGNKVFGPALVEAYKLESEYAIYPRILFSEKAAQCLDWNISFGAGDSAMMLKDSDGLRYLNILAYAINLGQIFGYDSLGRIRTNLLILKDNTKTSRERAKVEWYINYFNDTIDLLVKQHTELSTPVERIP